MEQGLSVVVADDEPIIRADVCQMLEELGFVIAGQAGDGFDTVECCRMQHPNLVLLDIKMPVFDGLSAAETIIEENLADSVVILTAYLDEELIEKAVAIGVTGYLVKPVETRILLPTLEVAWAQSKRLQKVRAQYTEMVQQAQQNKLIDRAKAALAKKEGISEAQAYRSLQQLAMEKRVSIGEISRRVVSQWDERANLQREKNKMMEKHALSEQQAFRQIRHRADERGISLVEAARQLTKENI